MSTPAGTDGRLVFFRLSDVPQKIRLDAARAVRDAEIRRAKDPLRALLNASRIEAVARDPERAAVEIPQECSNGLRSVSAIEWQRAIGTA